MSQGSLAAIENRNDLHLSTLAKYIRALGGELEMRAVFPEASFNLQPLAIVQHQPKGNARPARRPRRTENAV